MGYCEHYFVVENFSLPSKAAHISVDGNQIVVGQPQVYTYLKTDGYAWVGVKNMPLKLTIFTPYSAYFFPVGVHQVTPTWGKNEHVFGQVGGIENCVSASIILYADLR